MIAGSESLLTTSNLGFGWVAGNQAGLLEKYVCAGMSNYRCCGLVEATKGPGQFICRGLDLITGSVRLG